MVAKGCCLVAQALGVAFLGVLGLQPDRALPVLGQQRVQGGILVVEGASRQAAAYRVVVGNQEEVEIPLVRKKLRLVDGVEEEGAGSLRLAGRKNGCPHPVVGHVAVAAVDNRCRTHYLHLVAVDNVSHHSAAGKAGNLAAAAVAVARIEGALAYHQEPSALVFDSRYPEFSCGVAHGSVAAGRYKFVAVLLVQLAFRYRRRCFHKSACGCRLRLLGAYTNRSW